MQDYEFAGLQRQIAFRVARRVLVPDAIPVERLRRVGARSGKLVRYPGLKEEYYLADFEPDPGVLAELGLDREKVARRRPAAAGDLRLPRPTTTSTSGTIDRLAGEPRAQAVVIPRTDGAGRRRRGRSAPPT